MTRFTTNDDGHVIDQITQRKVLSTAPLMDGLCSCEAEITKTADGQRCQANTPIHVVPIILVPGIMGSCLVGAIAEAGQKPDGFSWDPNNLGRMAGSIFDDAKDRQKRLNPITTKVLFEINSIPSKYYDVLCQLFMGGKTQKDLKKEGSDYKKKLKEILTQRGWGTVMFDSYWPLLIALQNYLNPADNSITIDRFKNGETPEKFTSDPKTLNNPKNFDPEDPVNIELWQELKLDVKTGFNKIESLHCVGGLNPPTDLTSDEVSHALSYRYPVYAAGYNWLRTNYNSANGDDEWSLKKTVERVIADAQKYDHECNQVIIVTHSMGGLVARAYSKENEAKIHGVIHGVMPATGAPPMYKRMRAGFGGVEIEETDGFIPKAMGTAMALIMGANSYNTSAVLASCVGALELAPTMNYGNSLDTKQWLRVRNANGTDVRLPQSGDPYQEIYKSNKWYGLVPHYAPDDTAAGGNSRINPAGFDLGMPDREYFIKNIESAQFFHKVYMPHSYYHPKSYASYLAQGKAFETVTWVATGGTQYNPVGSEMGGVWTTESGSPIHTETELDAGELSPITSTNVDDYDLTEDGGRGNIGIRQGNRTQRYKVLGQDKGKGDGTVPRDSGAAPQPFVQAIFEQGHGVVNDHQESWTVPAAQRMALLAVTKIMKDDKRAD